MIDCLMVACVLAQLGQSDPLTQVATREPYDFRVVVSLSLRRLAAARVADAASLELRDAGDAVFFVRRVSGRYTHFIAFRDPAGNLLPPLLLTAAGCEIAA